MKSFTQRNGFRCAGLTQLAGMLSFACPPVPFKHPAHIGHFNSLPCQIWSALSCLIKQLWGFKPENAVGQERGYSSRSLQVTSSAAWALVYSLCRNAEPQKLPVELSMPPPQRHTQCQGKKGVNQRPCWCKDRRPEGTLRVFPFAVLYLWTGLGDGLPLRCVA